MDDDKRDLVGQLMATATAMLEDTHAIASKGQSAKPTHDELIACCEQLKIASDDIKTIANAAWIVSRCQINEAAEKR